MLGMMLIIITVSAVQANVLFIEDYSHISFSFYCFFRQANIHHCSFSCCFLPFYTKEIITAYVYLYQQLFARYVKIFLLNSFLLAANTGRNSQYRNNMQNTSLGLKHRARLSKFCILYFYRLLGFSVVLHLYLFFFFATVSQGLKKGT